MNRHGVYLLFCEIRLYFSRIISLGPPTIVISYNSEPTIPGALYGQCHTCFGFILIQDPLVNSPNIDKQLLFPIGSPNCTLSTFPGWGVGKCVSKENPKSDLDLGPGQIIVVLRKCKRYREIRKLFQPHSGRYGMIEAILIPFWSN